MKYKYYINNKQVNFYLFRSYLMQAMRFLIIHDETLKIPSIYDTNKLALDYFWSYFNEMKNSGISYTINKIEFKILRGC